MARHGLVFVLLHGAPTNSAVNRIGISCVAPWFISFYLFYYSLIYFIIHYFFILFILLTSILFCYVCLLFVVHVSYV